MPFKVRSELDVSLLRHTAVLGVIDFEGVKVDSIEFDNETHPRVAHYLSKDSGKKGRLYFDYLVNATRR